MLRQATRYELLSVNPAGGVELPALPDSVVQVIPLSEIPTRLDLFHGEDRVIWTIAFYAGLRAGEIQALGPKSVSLEAGQIAVINGYDKVEEETISPKSKAGERNVPILSPLRKVLEAHFETMPRRDCLLVRRDGVRPFRQETVVRRAGRIWSGAGLQPIGLHVARHTYVSLLIAAGANALAVRDLAGHQSVAFTFDRTATSSPAKPARLPRWLRLTYNAPSRAILAADSPN